MNNSHRYPAQVFWSDEDESFIAIAPDLPGCSAIGETQEKAVAELQTAIELSIEALAAAGNPVPKPSQHSNASGKIHLRLPKWLHAQLAAGAERADVSLNTHMVALLSRANTLEEVPDQEPVLRPIAVYPPEWPVHNCRVSRTHPREGIHVPSQTEFTAWTFAHIPGAKR